MSTLTPTLIPPAPEFPILLPAPPPPPAPLAKRNLQREMDDLSDEENELEDLVRACSFSSLLPIESRNWH